MLAHAWAKQLFLNESNQLQYHNMLLYVNRIDRILTPVCPSGRQTLSFFCSVNGCFLQRIVNQIFRVIDMNSCYNLVNSTSG